MAFPMRILIHQRAGQLPDRERLLEKTSPGAMGWAGCPYSSMM
jgi:hypothetical protein